jgi:hypothetical protein
MVPKSKEVSSFKIRIAFSLEDVLHKFIPDACLYLFYNKSAVRAKSKGKEKINLKDYLFQDGTPANKNKTSAIDFMESAVTQPINQSKALAPSGLDRKKPKVK